MSCKREIIASLFCLFTVAVRPASALPDTVSVRATNYPSLFFGWDGSDGVLIEPSDPLARERSTFRLVSGLADSAGVSFQCASNPDYYLRHQNNAIKLHKSESNGQFRSDATFRKVPGLFANAGDGNVSFEAINSAGSYIRHRNMKLALDPLDESDLYKNDATFAITPPNWDGVNPLAKPGEPLRVPIEPKQAVNLFLFIALAVAAIGLIAYALLGKSDERGPST